MKTWSQLTPAQQEMAVQERVQIILEAICEGSIKFTDPAVQAKIEEAARDAESMRTPWFMAGYVMDRVGLEVTASARHDCALMIYSEPHEVVAREPIITETKP